MDSQSKQMRKVHLSFVVSCHRCGRTHWSSSDRLRSHTPRPVARQHSARQTSGECSDSDNPGSSLSAPMTYPSSSQFCEVGPLGLQNHKWQVFVPCKAPQAFSGWSEAVLCLERETLAIVPPLAMLKIKANLQWYKKSKESVLVAVIGAKFWIFFRTFGSNIFQSQGVQGVQGVLSFLKRIRITELPIKSFLFSAWRGPPCGSPGRQCFAIHKLPKAKNLITKISRSCLPSIGDHGHDGPKEETCQDVLRCKSWPNRESSPEKKKNFQSSTSDTDSELHSRVMFYHLLISPSNHLRVKTRGCSKALVSEIQPLSVSRFWMAWCSSPQERHRKALIQIHSRCLFLCRTKWLILSAGSKTK